MAIGCGLILKPFSVLAAVIPLIGTISGTGGALILMLLALVISVIVIALKIHPGTASLYRQLQTAQPPRMTVVWIPPGPLIRARHQVPGLGTEWKIRPDGTAHQRGARHGGANDQWVRVRSRSARRAGG